MEKRSRHSVKRNALRAEADIPYPVEKRCSKCGQMKLATAFSKAKREKDGLKSYCSDCGSAMRRSWYLRNAESEIAKAAEWQKANPEKKKQIAKATYYKNHASRRARGKAAYESGKVQTLEASRIKYAEDAAYREKKKATSRKRYD